MWPQRLVVSAIVLLTFGVGIWLQWAVLMAVGLGVGLVAVLTLLLRFPARASWDDVEVPMRLSRNDEGVVRIRIAATPRTGRWLSAANSATAERVFVDGTEATAELAWPVDTSKRGIELVGPTVLEANDPFGVRRRVYATREQTAVLIVPKVSPVDVPEALQSSPDSAESRMRGADVFESLREYVTGDPLKLIHWKASARAGELMVRRNVDTHIPRVMVILDVDARSYDRPGSLFHALDEQAFERAVDLAASLCWYACTSAQRVLLVTNGPDRTRIDIDLRDRESALDWLATVNPSDDVTVGNDRLALTVKESQPRGLVFVTGPIQHVSRPVVGSLKHFGPVSVRRADPS